MSSRTRLHRKYKRKQKRCLKKSRKTRVLNTIKWDNYRTRCMANLCNYLMRKHMNTSTKIRPYPETPI